MVRDSQKAHERQMVRCFLRLMGWDFGRTQSAEHPDEHPDVTVVLRERAGSKTVGIEHTDLHWDSAPEVGSLNRRLCTFWREVRSSIMRRISHRKDRGYLGSILGSVSLVRDAPETRSRHVARAFARDLVNLAASADFRLGDSEVVHIYPFDRVEPKAPDIKSGWLCVGAKCRWPVLARHVKTLTLEASPGSELSRGNWRCLGTEWGFLPGKPGNLQQIVDGKCKKYADYDCHATDELWLLISAAAVSRSTRLGWWRPEIEDEVRSTCPETQPPDPFDRVFLHEIDDRWVARIWPQPAGLVAGQDGLGDISGQRGRPHRE